MNTNMYENEHNPPPKRPISGSAVARIVIWSVMLCILVGLLVLGVVFGRNIFSYGISLGGYSYEDADSYHVGNGESADSITALNIDWVAGSVKIVPADGDTVTVTEDYTGDTEECRMRWKVENGCLTVKFRSPYWFFGVAGKDTRKNLTVSIPASMLENLDKVDVSVVSADLTVQANAREMDIDAVSGTVNLTGTFETLDVDTVSGDITVNGIVRDADFDGTSARVRIHLSEQARTLDVDTVSGDVTVVLPADVSGFAAEMDSVSGGMELRGFEAGEVVQKIGSSAYVMGDGGMKINMDGVSAKLLIEKETNG